MKKEIVLDTNLLVLLVVGNTNIRYITVHRRLAEYTEGDFNLLKGLIAASAGIVTTPNVLSEASNLLRQIKDPAKSEIGTVFQRMIGETKEIYFPSTVAATHVEFLRVGLADTTLLEASRNNTILLSADLPLYLTACRTGISAINFNHERGL